MSQPFARSLAMMAAISQAYQLQGLMKDMALNRIGTYESRGHGGKHKARCAIKKANPTGGKTYPFSSARQDARHQRQGQHMAIVNGFEIMQALPTHRAHLEEWCKVDSYANGENDDDRLYA